MSLRLRRFDDVLALLAEYGIATQTRAPISALLRRYGVWLAGEREHAATDALAHLRTSKSYRRAVARVDDGRDDWPSEALVALMELENTLVELLGHGWPVWPHTHDNGVDYLVLEPRVAPSPSRAFVLFVFETIKGSDSSISTPTAERATRELHEGLGYGKLPLTLNQSLKDTRAELRKRVRQCAQGSRPWSATIFETYRRDAERAAGGSIWVPTLER